jgi:hypothetical protein
MTRHPACDKDE